MSQPIRHIAEEKPTDTWHAQNQHTESPCWTPRETPHRSPYVGDVLPLDSSSTCVRSYHQCVPPDPDARPQWRRRCWISGRWLFECIQQYHLKSYDNFHTYSSENGAAVGNTPGRLTWWLTYVHIYMTTASIRLWAADEKRTKSVAWIKHAPFLKLHRIYLSSKFCSCAPEFYP